MSAERDDVRWVPVGEVGEVRMGKQLSPVSKSADGQMPYLRVANVFEDRIDYSDVNTMGFTESEKRIYSLRPGDILLNEGQESLTNVGRSAIFDGPPNVFCFQNTLIRFRPGSEVLPKYAQAVFVQWRRMGEFAKVAEKTSISHLGGSRFARMLFPYISRERQRYIVEVLDSVAESERIAEAKIVKLATVRKVLVASLSEFRRISMKDLLIDGPKNGIYKSAEHYGASGIPIVRISSFHGGPSDLTSGLLRVRVSRSEVEQYALAVGDILINRVNTPTLVGKATMVAQIFEPTLFESNIMRCRVDVAKIRPAILQEWLSGPVVRSYFASRAKPAVSQASINRLDVASCPVPDMSHAEQAEFSAKLNALDESISVATEGVSKLHYLQRALAENLLACEVPSAADWLSAV